MPSPARLGAHFALSKHGFMTPMRQLSLARTMPKAGFFYYNKLTELD
jgi:hypothetical protein